MSSNVLTKNDLIMKLRAEIKALKIRVRRLEIKEEKSCETE